MRILIEEYSYDISHQSNKELVDLLQKVLYGIGVDKTQTIDGKVSLSYVGYFYNPDIQDCVFILPKVLIDENGKVLGNEKITPWDLLDKGLKALQDEERKFIYEFAVWIYRAIVVYNKDNKNNIIQPKNISQISHTRRRRTNTMLDVVLSLIQFGKDHQDFITFTLRNIHSGYNKINWTRTINRSQAIIQDGCPIYLNPVNKKRQVNFDEELLIIFYSILNYIKEKYGFQVNINVNFQLIKGAQFESYINGRGVIRLRQIKYKYFSDIALELWELCNAFFDRSQNIYSACELKEFLLAKNFYIVFEAIIDELVGSNQEKHDLDKKLYDQQDGKIVDHLYTYQGLMEAGNNDVPTYYIGDSKYYKIGSDLGEHSIFKQNTYARNIIQYNIDLWDEWDHNESKDEKKKPLKLRDKLTEGYNILPNFFISASMKENDYSYTHDQIERKEGGTKISYQFRDRLFDRDTLLLSHYNVNFLFIIALYARNNSSEKDGWMKKVREEFRQEIQRVLRANYDFYALRPKKGLALEQWINQNFKDVHGKIFRPYDDQELFILALEKNSQEVQNALHGKDRKPLEQIETNPSTYVKEEKDAQQDLLSEIESAFVVKKVEDLDAPLDVAIEKADRVAVENVPKEGDADMLPRYFVERYKQDYFVIGLYHDQAHWDWITGKNDRGTLIYNVRLDKQREGYQVQSSIRKMKPKFVILYEENHLDENKYHVFRVHDYAKMTEERMRQALYPGDPKGDYFIFRMDEEITIGAYDINAVVNEYMGKNKLENKGQPVYVTGEQLLKHQK